MPFYEYRCDSCGHQLEKLQRMNDAPLTECPECEESALRRLISAAGFRLKGSGWYETDFKKDNKRNVADSGSDTESKTSKQDSASESSDSKPAKSDKKDKPAADSGSKSDSTKTSAA